MLFVRYYTPLCSHAVRYVSSKAIAEDIVAEVFIQFQSRKAYETIENSYRSYLYKAVRNLALRYLRDEVTMVSDTSLSAQNTPEDQPSAQVLLEADEIRWHLQMAIEELSLPLQRVFIACRIEGKKQALVASELGLSVKTVEVYVARALQQVRQHMKKAGLLVLTILFNAF
ncbi:sigma-70 family RNA polymerase sigma factor [Siphonobacter sp. BAB-5385]|uniref:sigma-70 family RNA polymerase sigma factor n=1 Tax=Siphonobacter sp. BAB-5385 TaxID=1864822 RepID=UPI0015950DA7|nr:sigma-70 family RNA polymerase sigma factor [Siphonobacter sp. BAB-5385]